MVSMVGLIFGGLFLLGCVAFAWFGMLALDDLNGDDVEDDCE